MSQNELPKYYTVLFHAVEDALEALEEQNFGLAKELLILGQQHAEELFLKEDDK